MFNSPLQYQVRLDLCYDQAGLLFDNYTTTCWQTKCYVTWRHFNIRHASHLFCHSVRVLWMFELILNTPCYPLSVCPED